MASRKQAGKIFTPTPEELQALFDLPSGPDQQEEPPKLGPATPESVLVEHYNQVIEMLDILFEQANGGSVAALRRLRGLGADASIFFDFEQPGGRFAVSE